MSVELKLWLIDFNFKWIQVEEHYLNMFYHQVEVISYGCYNN